MAHFVLDNTHVPYEVFLKQWKFWNGANGIRIMLWLACASQREHTSHGFIHNPFMESQDLHVADAMTQAQYHLLGS